MSNQPNTNSQGARPQVAAPALARDEFEGVSAVTVYSRLPMAIVMQDEELTEVSEQTPLGVRQVSVHAPSGPRFVIEGNAKGRGTDAEKTEHKRIVAGFAVTEGIPAELWRRWSQRKKDMPFLMRGDIYAVAKEGDAAAKRRDADQTATGLDPIDPANPTPEFKKVAKAA